MEEAELYKEVLRERKRMEYVNQLGRNEIMKEEWLFHRERREKLRRDAEKEGIVLSPLPPLSTNKLMNGSLDNLVFHPNMDFPNFPELDNFNKVSCYFCIFIKLF